jgi:hypothetical protein
MFRRINGQLLNVVSFGRGARTRLSPGATLAMIDGAGQVPTVTHPQEVVDAIVRCFGT